MDMLLSDKEAIEVLYSKGKQLFFKYAQRFKLANEVLEDIYQEGFLALLLNIKSGIYKEEGTIIAYLIKVCSNKLNRYIAQQYKEREVMPLVVSEIARYYMSDTEREEALNVTVQLLEEADGACRQVLSLYYYENKRMAEIAEILQYANGAVAKQKKSSCLRRFARALKERLSEVGINWKTKNEK